MKRNKRGNAVLIALGSAAVSLTLLAVYAHPFFAITRASGGDSLVVEGWLHEEGMEEAARLFKKGGYRRLITTGTVRPFAYYMHHGDTLSLDSERAFEGAMELSIAGLPGAGILMETTDGDWSRINADPKVSEHSMECSSRRRIRMIAESDSPPASGEAVVFIAGLLMDGENAHAPWMHGSIRRADGSVEPLAPTFAHQAKARLMANGVPEAMITAVPTWSVVFSKTLSTAIDVTAYMDALGLDRFDVATLAVHARRTDRMYAIARAQRPGNGIIALHDPWCARWSWWGNYYGWYQMLKEIAALPLPWLAE